MAEVHEYDDLELRSHLRKFEILHKTYEKVKEHFKGNYKLTLKLIKTLENCREHESHQYKEASHFGNMLAVLYHLIDDDRYEGMAEKINKETRERFPKNMFAMMLQCHLCLDDGDISEANELLQRMEAINDDTVECSVIPRAEYAYMLVQFGPPYYSEAISEYEKAIAMLDNDKDRLTVIWCYDLLQTYNRLMNQGCIQAQKQSIKITPIQCFKNICQLLPKVLESDSVVHMFYQGKAYIELFDSYKKLRNRNAKHVKKIVKENLKVITEPESWLKKAYELAPTDGHVLERLGRHYRTIASNLEDFQRAEKFLIECTKKYQTRHVAFHHLALCYKSMWLEINGFKEAELHHNPVRMGCQQKRYGSKKKARNGENMYSHMSNTSKPRSKNKKKTRKNNQSETADTLDDNATFSDVTGACGTSEPNASSHVDDDDDGICLSMDNTADEPVKEVNRTCSSDSGTVHTSGEVGTPQHDSTVNDLTQQVQQCTHKIDERTLPPNKPAAFGQMPKQFSKPDYFDILRTSNPRKSPSTKQEYLEKAIKYIKQTNEIVEKTNCRYLTDWARLEICQGNTDDACKYFKAARKCQTTPYDLAYIWEQEALLREQLLEQKSRSMDDAQYLKEEKNVLAAYRESVRQSSLAREKSRMAFYQLKDILESKIEEYSGISTHARSLEIIQSEYSLLFCYVENLGKAKGYIHEVMKNHPEVVDAQWELIHSFYRAKEYLSAYQYMMPLLENTEKLETYIDKVDAEQCLQIALNVSEEYMNTDQLKEAKSIHKEIFWALINVLSINTPNTQNEEQNWRPGEHNSANVLLLSNDSEELGEEFKEFLEDICGLSVFGYNDIIIGQCVMTAFCRKVATANVMIAFSDLEGQSEHCLKEFLSAEANVQQPKVLLSGVVDQRVKQSSIPSVYLNDFSVDMSSLEKHHLVRCLYEAMFVEYKKYMKKTGVIVE